MRSIFRDLEWQAFRAGFALLLITGAASAAAPVSDDFHTAALNAGLWTLVNPVGDGSYKLTGSNLFLAAPAGSNHDPQFGGADNAVRMMQNITSVDFEVEAKFDSIPTRFYQSEGIIVEQDAQNYLRFDIASDGAKNYVAATKLVNSVATTQASSAISITGASVWMRVQKSGSTWTLTWSSNGSTYNTGATFTQAFTVARIGPYGGNYGQPAGSAPAFTASVDYFFNTASPIAPEDAGGPNLSLTSVSTAPTGATVTWTTDVAASSRVDYGLTTSYGQNVSSSTLVTSHSVAITGLTCGTTYDFDVTSTVSGGSTVSPNGSFSTPNCAAVPDMTITKSHSGNFTQGQTGATYTIAAKNSGGGPTTSAVSVSDTIPTGLTATGITGTGWSCTGNAGPCTRSDVLASGASYPALILTVNVAGNAPSSVTNTATVSGGGETTTSNDTAGDLTAINPPSPPDMTITESHSGNFTEGQTGATYTITAKNSGTGPTTSAVSVSDTIPTGLAATGITGTGWSCTGNAGPCTRSDVLGSGASYPALILTVNVAGNAPSSVTNTATVSGGGETNTSNDTASDLTTINPAGGGGPVSDDFHSTALNTSRWTILNPVGNGTFAMTGSDLALTVPAGTNHDPEFNGADNALRAIQTVPNADFTVEVKFDSIPSQQYQFEGILVEQDAANYLRFQFGSTGNSLTVAADVILAHNGTGLFSPVVTLPAGTTSLWLRVQKSGSTWTVTWSGNGTTYNTAGSFTQALTVADLGPFVGNYSDGSAPAFTANVDYVFNTASPIVPEDAGGPNLSLTAVSTTATGATVSWTTDVAASSRVDYGPTKSYGQNVSSATLVTAHSVVITGLTCGSVYDFDVTSAVSGGSTVSPNGSFSTPNCAAVPDMTITKSHSGNFTQGQTGATYTIAVKNSGGGPTTSAVSVSDTIPTGLTATGITGTGWSCTGNAGPCTRSDVLASGASYPALILTVNVAGNAPSSVTNTATVSGGGETNTSNDTASDLTTINPAGGGGPVSDDFHSTALNTSRWTIANPVGDGTFVMTGSDLVLTVPGGTNHDPEFNGADNALRAIQAVPNADFTVEVKFDSIPSQQYQFEGILVEQDAANYLRFQFGSTGSSLTVAADVILAHNGTGLFSPVITLPGGTTSLWLRVQKSGSTWTETWSANGSTYNTAGSFTQPLTVADLGPFVGNYSNTSAPAFTANIDYVFNTASPVTPEDAGGPNLSLTSVSTTATGATVTWTTDVAASSRVDYGSTTSYGQNVSSATLVTSHSVAITGLTCGTTYDFDVTSAVSGGSTVSPNGTFTTANCGPSGPVSDDFRNTTLNAGLWTFVDPFGGSYSLSGTNLVLTVPGGYIHDPVLQGPNDSLRMMQSTANVNFGVEAKFDTVPVEAITEQGILVQQDGSHFLRFEFQGVGSGTNLFASAVIGGAQTTFYNNGISIPSPPVWMRVGRSGNSWTLSWSTNGSTYTTATTFTQALTVSSIGPMVGNYQDPVGASPDFAASIDYFFNTATPIVPEDGGEPQISSVSSIPGIASAAITWSTDEPATSKVDFGTTLSYGTTVTDATLVTSHALLISGLSCATSYDYAVTSFDVGSNSKQTSNFSFVTPPCSGAAAPVSDGFDTSSLNTTLWTFVDPVKDSYLAFNGTTAEITVPYGSVHDPWANKGNQSTRIMQPIANVNFDVVAKFVSELDWGTTAQGIVVEQDALHYIRFEFQSNGSTTSVFAGTRSGNAEAVVVNTPIHGFSPLWLRVTRSSDTWTVSWSADGNSYTQAGSFAQTLTSAGIGVYAANYGGTLKLTAALTAAVDFFINTSAPGTNVVAPIPFSRIVIDPTPGAAVVEKTMADLDGDGRPDAVIGLESPNQGMFWYRSPHNGVVTDTWNRFAISTTGQFYEDVIAFDINGDGAVDLVTSVDGGISWYENPLGKTGDPTQPWTAHVVTTNSPGENTFSLADLDGDGKIDIISPSAIYFQNNPDSWFTLQYNNSFRGTALLDIGSGKGAINIVGSTGTVAFPTVWFENPRESGGNARTSTWVSHQIGPGYPCTSVSCADGSPTNVGVGDINGDGRVDVVTVQAEGSPTVVPAGGVIWWEAPVDRRNGQWIQHTIDPGFVNAHNVRVFDMDKNGTLDLVVAEQEQSPERRLSVYYNDGLGNFSGQILSNTSGHNPFVIDINRDGWLDILSTAHGYFGAPNPVELYINRRGGFSLP